MTSIPYYLSAGPAYISLLLDLHFNFGVKSDPVWWSLLWYMYMYLLWYLL